MGDRASAGDRAKAYRLRKLRTSSKLMPIDALWLADYEEKEERRTRSRAADVGASRSRSGRKVKFEMEEDAEAEAIGTGTAATVAAAAALQVKEEGRRLDSLTIESVGALKEAVAVYRDVCLSMRRRMEALEDNHVEMLEAVRTQYLARTQAEINALESATGDGDAITKMAESLLPHMFKNGAAKGSES